MADAVQQAGAVPENTEEESMTDVDGQSPFPQNRKPGTPVRNHQQQEKQQQEGKSIACQAQGSSPHNGKSHGVIGIPSVEYPGRQHPVKVVCKEKYQITSQKADGQKKAFAGADPVKQRAVKMKAGQKKREEIQNAGNGQKIVQPGTPDQQTCRRHKNHMAGDFQENRRQKSPEKQCHQIPERKFRPGEIKPGLFIQQKIKKIVQKFIDKIGNHNTANQLPQGSFLFGKIAGNKHKGRHMKRVNSPFEIVQKQIFFAGGAGFHEMADDYQKYQQRLAVVKQIFPRMSAGRIRCM